MRKTSGARTVDVPEFDPGQFTATEYATVAEKAAFATQLARFIAGGFLQAAFTQPLYRRLCTMFGHIAHYDRDGFYATWFSTEDARLRFVENMLAWRPCGSPRFTFCDVEGAVAVWAADAGLVERYRDRVTQAREAADLATLAALVERYPEPARELVVEATLARSR